MNIDKLIENPDDAKDKELLLSKEDMIKKFLNFIEFWKEKGSSRNSVLFTLKFLRHIIVRGNCSNN